MGAAEWCGYSSTSQYGSYSPLQPYCENVDHPTSLHLPTVLPDSGCTHPQGDFGGGSPGGGGLGGGGLGSGGLGGGGQGGARPYPALTELEPLLAPRYPAEPAAYAGAWPAPANGYNAYNNYQYAGAGGNSNAACAQPQGAYLSPPGPTMLLYPHLYSTVNQNQIHFHLHGSTDKLDQYFSGDSALTISSGPSLKGGIEIGIGVPPQQQQLEADSQHPQDPERDSAMTGAHSLPDPSSVWRPY